MSLSHGRAIDPSRSRSGFTLLELLVVIAIIILIISITLPALSGARDIARTTSSRALMTNLSTAIGQYRNDNDDQMPGPFTQVELGSSNNQMVGLTAMENAMLDLVAADAIGNGDDQISLDPAGTGGIDVGLDLIGAGSSYFDITATNYVAQTDGLQLGTVDPRLPDLVDAFGNPVLLWVEDTGAPLPPADIDEFAAIDSESGRARFYWNTNAAFLDAPFLGKSGEPQFAESILSSARDAADRQNAMAALLGDPGSPTPAVGLTADNVLPASARGRYIIQSAGRDGVFLSAEDKNTAGLAYRDNFFLRDGSRLTDDADEVTSEDVIDATNDIIVSGR